jgi:hypothetical protein
MIVIRRSGYLRRYAEEFMRTLAPPLTQRSIRRALTGQDE